MEAGQCAALAARRRFAPAAVVAGVVAGAVMCIIDLEERVDASLRDEHGELLA